MQAWEGVVYVAESTSRARLRLIRRDVVRNNQRYPLP
jgi:hypothetical protein